MILLVCVLCFKASRWDQAVQGRPDRHLQGSKCVCAILHSMVSRATEVCFVFTLTCLQHHQFIKQWFDWVVVGVVLCFVVSIMVKMGSCGE